MTLDNAPGWPRSRYDSKINNITTEFFIPALRESTTYRRIAGFFSSTSLSLAARGIKELIDNDGKMQLVVSPILTKEDAAVLNSDADKKDEILAKSFADSLDMSEAFEKNHIAALAYMLKKEFLEIKVDIPTDAYGTCLDYEAVMRKNTLVEKLGIFQDRNGNAVSFRGPISENRQSWEHGIFEITVDTSWVEGQRIHVDSDIGRFEKKWQAASTVNLPQKTRDQLLMIAPSDTSEIDIGRFDVPGWARLPDGHVLWGHQIQAVNSWFDSNCRGILNLATSGGKTLAALVCASLVPDDSIVVVLVPTKVLVKQWEKEITNFDQDADLVMCDSDHSGWETILSGKTGSYVTGNVNRTKRLWVLSTMHTAASERFRGNFEHIPPKFMTVIADEVHHTAAPKYSKAFELNPLRRLGLSATFVRDWDELGTDKIREYFGHELDVSYAVSDGIRDGRLSRYEYHPFFAHMSELEYADYVEQSKEIGIVYAKLQTIKNTSSKTSLEKRYSQLLINRAEILKKAKDKSRAYGNILLSLPKKPYIVFADDNEQIDELKPMHKHTIRRINMQKTENLEKDDIMTFSGNSDPDTRKNILEEAKANQTPLFAMHCLDEGIDMPEFQSAILVSSSASRRQYIQRRGRILRTTGNRIAHLYDIIVLPNPHAYDVDPDDVKTIVDRERERVNDLAKDAINKQDAIRTFDAELQKLHLAPQ